MTDTPLFANRVASELSKMFKDMEQIYRMKPKPKDEAFWAWVDKWDLAFGAAIKKRPATFPEVQQTCADYRRKFEKAVAR